MGNIKILGVKVNNTTKEEALEFIVKGLQKEGQKVKIFTPNPEIIMAALKDKGFKKVINTADLALPDGVGLLWAAKMLGKQLRKRIPGADFMELLCNEASKRGFTVGLMGGGPKIAERTRDCLLRMYPSLKIAFVGEEWPEISTFYHLPSNIDILFVAFGFPKQEQWIYENLPNIPVRVAMAVGGSFDYISGAVPRAPLWMRNVGLEWLFRLVIQPWRLRRQLVLLKFIYKIIKTRLSS